MLLLSDGEQPLAVMSVGTLSTDEKRASIFGDSGRQIIGNATANGLSEVVTQAVKRVRSFRMGLVDFFHLK